MLGAGVRNPSLRWWRNPDPRPNPNNPNPNPPNPNPNHTLTLGAVAESRGVSMSREGNPEDSDHLVGYHVVDGVMQPVQIFRVEG